MTGVHPPLTADELAELTGLVAAEQDRLAAQLAALVRTFDELVDAADLEPPDDEHDPDGTTAYERAQVSSLIIETRSALAQLAAAAQRIDAGTYGRCVACGDPIGWARLAAVPAAQRCIRCAT
ncbi:MAG: TraR/DksA family transcriptional regulator [Acidimicrobiales bacterium]|nr:TraR/DksA family transcriptional regulator [Acidimicrobiales bacterium]